MIKSRNIKYKSQIGEAMRLCLEVAGSTQRRDVFNKMMGAQAALQVVLGLSKPTDAVSIVNRIVKWKTFVP